MSRVCLPPISSGARGRKADSPTEITYRLVVHATGLTKHIAVATRMLAPGFLRRARAMTRARQAPMTLRPRREVPRGHSQLTVIIITERKIVISPIERA